MTGEGGGETDGGTTRWWNLSRRRRVHQLWHLHKRRNRGECKSCDLRSQRWKLCLKATWVITTVTENDAGMSDMFDNGMGNGGMITATESVGGDITVSTNQLMGDIAVSNRTRGRRIHLGHEVWTLC